MTVLAMNFNTDFNTIITQMDANATVAIYIITFLNYIAGKIVDIHFKLSEKLLWCLHEGKI